MTFEQYYEKNEKKFLADLAQLIAIPGVVSEPSGEDAPFGRKVKESLECILNLGANLGFHVKNVDNCVGEITMGEGRHLLGILCHADVVDAGAGWNTEPFTAVNDGEYLYGRGAVDDKGPLISCLYAMKYLKEQNLIPDDIKVRMIVGTDEEANWLSITKYLQTKPEIPEISIVPDASFPVIFCEKGLINLTLTIPVVSKSILPQENRLSFSIEYLSGGERVNVVAAEANCILSCDRENADLTEVVSDINRISQKWDAAISVKLLGDGKLSISAEGKAAHAMTPEKGINAISYIMMLLYSLSQCDRYYFIQEDLLASFRKYFGLEFDGASLGIKASDEESGELTVNIGLMEMQGNRLQLGLNLRYPVTDTFKRISSAVEAVCKKENAAVEYGVCMSPIFFERSSQIVKTLTEVYRKCTGDVNSEPVSLGGATYARAIPNAIAFGPVFPGQEELAHEANECFALNDYRRITEIYAEALLALGKLLVKNH